MIFFIEKESFTLTYYLKIYKTRMCIFQTKKKKKKIALEKTNSKSYWKYHYPIIHDIFIIKLPINFQYSCYLFSLCLIEYKNSKKVDFAHGS